MIGLYVVEFEQRGEDRARYGQNLIPSIATTLSKRGHKGFAKSNLYNYKNFYLAYPQIFQTLSGKLDLSNHPTILQIGAEKQTAHTNDLPFVDINLMLNRLTFSHFLELIRVEDPLKRRFYEVECLPRSGNATQFYSA